MKVKTDFKFIFCELIYQIGFNVFTLSVTRSAYFRQLHRVAGAMI